MLVPCPFIIQLYNLVHARLYKRESRYTLAERTRSPSIPIRRETLILVYTAIIARDVCSPKGYIKGVGYTYSRGKAGRPLQHLERRERD